MERGGNILIVDDNDDDAFFVEKAFKSAGSPVHFFRCIDGLEAKAYLEAEAPFSNRGMYPLPDVILLDMKLPQMRGLDVLRWIREHPRLHYLIVILLTSTPLQRDVDEAYGLKVNSFLTKSGDMAEMVEMAKAIKFCWLKNLPSIPELKRAA